MRYLALSKRADIEVCEYPDSNKVGVYAKAESASRLHTMFRSEATVEYYDREAIDAEQG